MSTSFFFYFKNIVEASCFQTDTSFEFTFRKYSWATRKFGYWINTIIIVHQMFVSLNVAALSKIHRKTEQCPFNPFAYISSLSCPGSRGFSFPFLAQMWGFFYRKEARKPLGPGHVLLGVLALKTNIHLNKGSRNGIEKYLKVCLTPCFSSREMFLPVSFLQCRKTCFDKIPRPFCTVLSWSLL